MSGNDLKWVRKVVRSRRLQRPYAGLSALDGRRDGHLGLSPQAGMGRTVGAQGRRLAGLTTTQPRRQSQTQRDVLLVFDSGGPKAQPHPSLGPTAPGALMPRTLRAESPR
jgi:hypothetical protein